MNEEYKVDALAALDDEATMVTLGKKSLLRSELRIARDELRSSTGLLLNAGAADFDKATLSVQLAADKINWLIRCLGTL